ncbi:hypothetical protein QFZ61_001741 [Arthrobacter sp. B3I4]|nr:hypothetical protein [Arthrobacter sp. B3I4]
MSVATEVLNEESAAGVNEEWQIVHRVVFPTDGDTDTLPLYLDFNAAQRVVSGEAQDSKSGSGVTAVSSAGAAVRTDFLDNRRQLHLPAFRRVSFGTYFNAFPASYWRAHTDVAAVRLTVAVDAPATVVISRSTSRGTSNRVESITVDAGSPADVVLPLANFGDGGWYWFDLVAGSEKVKLIGAEWSVRKPDGFVPGTATVAVTTFNRPDYCVKHLTTFAESPELLEVVDRLLITDQGTQKVRDQDGYAEAAARLGDKFAIIEQGNLGGSGGFARGMQETVEDGRSKYVLLLDDDVIIETEGVLRAINFADYTRKPTIVGGHMFNLYERSVMHTFGEEVNEYKFFWGAVESTREGHDFSASNLRTTPLDAPPDRRRLQRLVDVPGADQHRARNRPGAAGVHQVGRRRVRHPCPPPRLPDRYAARRCSLAHAVDGEGRHHRLAGLLPPAQPVAGCPRLLALQEGRHPAPSELHGGRQAPAVDAVFRC